MDQENIVKNWLTATVFEYSCKNNFIPVIKKILNDQELSQSLCKNLTCDLIKNDRENIKPVFILIVMLRRLLSAVETFASDIAVNCYPWNSDDLQKIIKLLERTYEQCEFISLKKFFSVVTQLKFLDLMHLLRSKDESSLLVQKLNLYFPRWQANQKANLEKQFSIENPKILDKVEESNTQCRRLILKLVADPAYRTHYMSQQFSNDMKKMMIESVIYLKEIIENLSSNSGQTVMEKGFLHHRICSESEDLGYQVLFDYIQPEATSESLLRFLDELDPALAPPTGGFSSCLLPFDTMSECSDAMDLDCDDSESESSADESPDEKDQTLTQSDEEHA